MAAGAACWTGLCLYVAGRVIKPGLGVVLLVCAARQCSMPGKRPRREQHKISGSLGSSHSSQCSNKRRHTQTACSNTFPQPAANTGQQISSARRKISIGICSGRNDDWAESEKIGQGTHSLREEDLLKRDFSGNY